MVSLFPSFLLCYIETLCSYDKRQYHSVIKNTRFEFCFYHLSAMWAYPLCVLVLLYSDTDLIHLIELLGAVNNMIQEKHLEQLLALWECATIVKHPYKLLFLPFLFFLLSSPTKHLWSTCVEPGIYWGRHQKYEAPNCKGGFQFPAMLLSVEETQHSHQGTQWAEIYCHWCVCVLSSPFIHLTNVYRAHTLFSA